MISFVRATLFVLCVAGVSADPHVALDGGRDEECLPNGPHFDEEGTDYPIILDLGTRATSNGSGCHGCNVEWDIAVIWQHEGDAITVDWDDVVGDHKVYHGELSYFEGIDFVDCNSDSTFDAGSSTGTATVWVECSRCQ